MSGRPAMRYMMQPCEVAWSAGLGRALTPGSLEGRLEGRRPLASYLQVWDCPTPIRRDPRPLLGVKATGEIWQPHAPVRKTEDSEARGIYYYYYLRSIKYCTMFHSIVAAGHSQGRAGRLSNGALRSKQALQNTLRWAHWARWARWACWALFTMPALSSFCVTYLSSGAQRNTGVGIPWYVQCTYVTCSLDGPLPGRSHVRMLSRAPRHLLARCPRSRSRVSTSRQGSFTVYSRHVPSTASYTTTLLYNSHKRGVPAVLTPHVPPLPQATPANKVVGCRKKKEKKKKKPPSKTRRH